MKQIGLLLTGFFLLSLLLAGCTAGPGSIKADIEKEFALAEGQSASITGKNLTVKFVKVTEDSRCPRDVVCVWAGQVTCAVEITRNGISEQVKLTQPGLSDVTAGLEAGGYYFRFRVTPYPVSSKEIASNEYRLNMTVIPRVGLGEGFTLTRGQSVFVSGASLLLNFLDVTEDSRCPKDVICVWAGQVACALDVTRNGVTEQVKLIQPGLSDNAQGQIVSGYSFKFQVRPYPEAGKQIAKNDYRLDITVTK